VSDDRSTVKWSSRVEHVLLSVVVSDGGEATAALSARMRAGARKQSAACYLIWQHLPDSHAGQQGERKIQVVRNYRQSELIAFGNLVVVHIGVQLHGSVVRGRSMCSPDHKLTLPGLNSSSGSTACFIVLISCTVPTPSSCTRNSFLPTPTPCSPVPGGE